MKTLPVFPGARHPYRPPALAQAAAAAGFGSLHRCLDKIVLNQRRNGVGSEENLLESIMRAVENNGQVTLPGRIPHANGWKIAAGIVAGLAGVGALVAVILR